MIYLNHAATTYPKPPGVPEAVAKALESAPQSQYRGVSAGEYGEDRIKLCRENLARLFQIGNPERIFFTSGSTQALNMAILGYRSPRKRIVYTAAEHNSVLRTIFDGLKEEIRAGRVLPVEVGCDRGGYVDMEAMERAITGDTGLVIVNHSSNVTGAVQDIRQIGSWAREKGACFLADVSQSAGALPVDVEAMNIDMLAFTGHKGLYGIQGTGGLYVREGIPLRPLLFGGTGKDSRTLVAQEPFYEVGTMNMPGIAGLNAGVEYVLETGLEKIMAHERYMMRILFEGLRALPGVALCGDRQPGGTAISFTVPGFSPSDIGYILAGTYGIQVRTGLHCAPLLHRYLGTEKEGTVRVSISFMTKEEEVRALVEAVAEFTAGIGKLG
ncbi:MAG: aminotransferase class V-fold PLP-dependent enzyme [Lachnospiraceae bacterium]|nr:aminotransferase class V-fold PLP-dependent enzyme [Lachnospiraceae bacterium]